MHIQSHVKILSVQLNVAASKQINTTGGLGVDADEKC